MKTLLFCLLAMATVSGPVSATPYPDPGALLPINRFPVLARKAALSPARSLDAIPMVRLQIDWQEGERYQLSSIVRENSGTDALVKRALTRDPWGSYIAELKVEGVTYYDSLGTGKEYRRLARSLSFRFPVVAGKGELKLFAENPQTGLHEVVLEETVDLSSAKALAPQEVEVRILQEAAEAHPIVFTIYADGYTSDRKERFFQDAAKVPKTFASTRFPRHQSFRFVAVFAPSKTRIGRAQDLGATPVKRDAFLGLYFPHWNKFGRWGDVVYPTDESQLRAGLGQVPYDYPLVLLDDSGYWGVGNYRMYTAIPGGASQFDFLLLHEFGHYLGLNEEYEEGGRTELEFAPEIHEPWSANMTFHPHRGELKWEHLVDAGTSLPTHTWGAGNKVGAYVGGYAGSAPAGVNHKPAMNCMMNHGGDFCPVCIEGIQTQMKKDSGGQN